MTTSKILVCSIALLMWLPGCKKDTPQAEGSAETAEDPCETDDDCDEGFRCDEGSCKQTTADKMRDLKKKKLEERDRKMKEAMGE
ncbi:MAG: hypothetical protein JRI23_19440 [Deltaproteobacteria bacterium]|jgi:hypothetical protein|nr:hypothetical protein [Deltaproteobacteria bacterium]MBW2534039.1 hypothetical protein [Deltaproteobacteria bacterium]